MEKTKLMEESMKQLDEEMRRSDELLSQMIPKQVTSFLSVHFSQIRTMTIHIQF
jgi:hypothetical protein